MLAPAFAALDQPWPPLAATGPYRHLSSFAAAAMMLSKYHQMLTSSEDN